MQQSQQPAAALRPVISHLARFWHIHLTIWSVLLAGIIFGAGGAVAVQHACGLNSSLCTGGYKPGPLPPRFRLLGGSPIAFSLVRDEVRVHNQGSYWSCVGQTLATMEEITQRERGHQFQFSSGFIWNQLNGGNPDQGIAYADAFRILTQQGDPRLRDFAPDGYSDYSVQPNPAARAAALPFRFTRWGSIDPADRATIQAEIASGRPIAIAIHAYSNFANLWAGYPSPPVLDDQAGAYLYDHSVTGVGYSPTGVEIQNSYGPSWGFQGRAVLTWHYLAATGTYIVGAVPGNYYPPAPTPRPRPTPAPALPRNLDCSSPLAGGEKLCVLRPHGHA
ncbi:MAG TPA: C1 family peptidase [Chloroflexota bacterium]|nr:C1 family peptidase [Chloroflexota bacterium]